MNVYLKSADARGRIDGSILGHLLSRIPDLVADEESADVVLVVVSLYPDYEFNTELEKLAKPIVLVDFMEYGLSWDAKESHLWGQTLFEKAPVAVLDARWKGFDDWVRQRQPILYFKRELLAKDGSERVKPIEFPCYLDVPPIQSEAEFNARPIDCFFWWGYSHPSRPKLHGQIFEALCSKGIGLISNWDQFEGYMATPVKPTFASIHVPHYTRKPLPEIVNWQMRSKITLALPGNGQKTFRHGEVVGSIMGTWEEPLAWAYPWTSSNSIRLIPHVEWESVNLALVFNNLYPIYVAGQENMMRYQSNRYVNEYVLPAIAAVL